VHQNVYLQNLENLWHWEGHQFKFQSLDYWKALKLWNRAGPICQWPSPPSGPPVSGRLLHLAHHMLFGCLVPDTFKSIGVPTASVESHRRNPLGMHRRSCPRWPSPQLTAPHVLAIAIVPHRSVLPTQVVVAGPEAAAIKDPPQSHPMPSLCRWALEDHHPGAPPRYDKSATSQGASSTRRPQELKPTAESPTAVSNSPALDSSDHSRTPSTPSRASRRQGVPPQPLKPCRWPPLQLADLPPPLSILSTVDKPPGEPPPLSCPISGPRAKSAEWARPLSWSGGSCHYWRSPLQQWRFSFILRINSKLNSNLV
jgi:hypothetical protein